MFANQVPYIFYCRILQTQSSTGFRSGEFGGHKSGVCWTNYRALLSFHTV